VVADHRNAPVNDERVSTDDVERLMWSRTPRSQVVPFPSKRTRDDTGAKRTEGESDALSVCGIDESGSREAVRAPVDFSRTNNSNLTLVCVVKDKLYSALQTAA
jgi:hypothetical protein